MTRFDAAPVRRPGGRSGRWSSFVADPPAPGHATRSLHEQGNPQHRVRVEHDDHTLLVHVSDEDGHGWTTLAIDRGTRSWAVAHRDTQLAAATSAHRTLYGPDS